MIMNKQLSDIVQHIKSHDNVFIHSVAAAPQSLINAMTARHKELENVSIYSIHTEGEAPYATIEMEKSFNLKSNSFVLFANSRVLF